MDDLEFVTTDDGSHTLRNRTLNETYHSVHGAVQESRHVFINNGLRNYCVAHSPSEVSVLEVGFGTGLNAWLALQFAVEQNIPIRYVTLEPFPLPEEIWSQLNYGEGARSLFEALHRADWNEPVAIHSLFTFSKLKIALAELTITDVFDVVFFDAFAASIQPALWEYSALQKTTDLMHPGSIFVTYSAKGQLKRDLKALGLTVETLPGPPGKKEMVRGVKR